jgi:hypothetical protein
LDHIAYIATDFNPKSIKKKKDYFTIRVYGRTLQENYDNNEITNLSPVEMDLDV